MSKPEICATKADPKTLSNEALLLTLHAITSELLQRLSNEKKLDLINADEGELKQMIFNDLKSIGLVYDISDMKDVVQTVKEKSQIDISQTPRAYFENRTEILKQLKEVVPV